MLRKVKGPPYFGKVVFWGGVYIYIWNVSFPLVMRRVFQERRERGAKRPRDTDGR